MPLPEPAYRDETVASWRNSSLDARLEDGQLEPRSSIDEDTSRYSEELVEATYHAASAGDFDSAAAILYNHLYGGPAARLTSLSGKYEVALDLLTQFFPAGDLDLDPRVNDLRAMRWIMHEASVCLHVLGRLTQAASLGLRAAAAASAQNDWHNAAVTQHNLAETFLAHGALESCRSAANSALGLAQESGDREDALVAFTVLGRLADLVGDDSAAHLLFDSALRIATKETKVPILYSLSGVRYGHHLLMSGQPAAALAASTANVDFCREQGWESDLALALALLSMIPNDSGEMSSDARSEEAVTLARTLGGKHVLAEALLARGRFACRTGRGKEAMAAAGEALSIAQTLGLRLAEVDARLVLAETSTDLGRTIDAQADAYLARSLADSLGYSRAISRAEAVLVEDAARPDRAP